MSDKLEQGKIDANGEISKIEKKKALIVSLSEKLKSAEKMPEYEAKIPQAVRDKNSEKVSLLLYFCSGAHLLSQIKEYDGELEALEASIVKLQLFAEQ